MQPWKIDTIWINIVGRSAPNRLLQIHVHDTYVSFERATTYILHFLKLSEELDTQVHGVPSAISLNKI